MRLPRVTIRQMMIAVAVVAGVLFLLRSQGNVFVVLAPLYVVLVVATWRLVRGRRRLATWGFGVSSFVVNGFVALLCAYLLDLGGMVFMALGSFCGLSVVLGLGTAWADATTRRGVSYRFSPRVAWPLVLTMAVVPATMTATYWPLNVAFLVSQPAMDRLADRIVAGESIRRPEWAGLYYVVGSVTQPNTRNVALLIDADRSGRSGFVRLEPDTSPCQNTPLTNLNFDIQMVGGWWYQNED